MRSQVCISLSFILICLCVFIQIIFENNLDYEAYMAHMLYFKKGFPHRLHTFMMLLLLQYLNTMASNTYSMSDENIVHVYALDLNENVPRYVRCKIQNVMF